MSGLPAFTDAEMEAFDVARNIQKRFQEEGMRGNIKFDWNGHHRRRTTQPTFPASYENDFRRDFPYEEEVAKHPCVDFSVEHNKKVLALFDDPGIYLPFGKITYNMGCFDCGKDLDLAFDGRTVRATNRCAYPKGLPAIKAVISVPSGKLHFTNYFADLPAPKTGRGMGALAFKVETKHYAKHNVAYGACGNSCPRIWVNAKKDKLIVGNPAYTEKMEDVPNAFPGYTEVGGVTTDLWAWSAACADTVKTFDDNSVETRVTVLAGKYRVSQMFHLCDHDNLRVPRKFATIERIGR